jgi:ribosomal protein L33
MAKKKNPVEVFNFVCKECGSSNYVQRLKKENKGVQLTKYCPAERKRTLHSAKKA